MREKSVYRLSNFLKEKLPFQLFSLIKKIGTALLTPIFFSYQSGHFLSSIKSKAVNKKGKPALWYTFPMNDFLEHKYYKNRSILEFGGGQSTLWWAQRAKEVVSLEGSMKWVEYIHENTSSNVTVYHVKDNGLPTARNYLDYRLFDIIIIDSLHRFKCAVWSMKRLKKGGALILDDSDGYWTNSFPIIEIFRNAGFFRIDFYGYAPGVFLPHCTSLFFKKDCFLLSGNERPVAKIS